MIPEITALQLHRIISSKLERFRDCGRDIVEYERGTPKEIRDALLSDLNDATNSHAQAFINDCPIKDLPVDFQYAISARLCHILFSLENLNPKHRIPLIGKNKVIYDDPLSFVLFGFDYDLIAQNSD